MDLWAVVEHGQPLEHVTQPDPVPVGTEVVIAVTHCGVCRSDLNLWKGEYDLGGGQTLRVRDRGVTLPRAPGHEVLGTVVQIGPEATGVAVGDTRLVYPFLGCGDCERCAQGQENLCGSQTIIGIMRHGGFSSQVVVPHPRYLFDTQGIEPALAATLACAGTTAWSAIKKLPDLAPDAPVLLIGVGGVGSTALRMLVARGHTRVLVVDVDANRRRAALAAGAVAALDGAAPDLAQAVAAAAAAPLLAAIDFVNHPSTAGTALELLAKGGHLVLVGVGRGELPVSLVGMVMRPRSIIGSVTGSLQELQEVLDLAASGALPPLPVAVLPKHAANEALQRLRAGEVEGRLVLRA